MGPKLPCGRSLLYLTSLIVALLSTSLPSPTMAMYGQAKGSEVVAITTPLQFERTVLQSDAIWIVQFYAPFSEESQEFFSHYNTLSAIFKGIVKYAAVDATMKPMRPLANRYNVSSYPTILIFDDGKDETDGGKGPVLYKGSTKEPRKFLENVIQHMVNLFNSRAKGDFGKMFGDGNDDEPSPVEVLTEDTFDEIYDSNDVWMVAFVAPWCGHCQQLKPEWEMAAKELKAEGVKMATVDATTEENLARDFRVQGFPTIRIFPGGTKFGPDDAKEYQGGRQKSQLIQAALAEVDRSGVPRPIEEMTTHNGLLKNCAGMNRLCVVAALPHILESMAVGRKKYIATMQAVRKQYRGQPVDFLWFEGGSQLALEEAWGLTFGYPAVVAVSLSKKAFSVMMGSFNDATISKFISATVNGRQRTTKFKELPEVETVEPWDGEDGVPFEDEPLDDIMGWDDDDDDDDDEKEGDEL